MSEDKGTSMPTTAELARIMATEAEEATHHQGGTVTGALFVLVAQRLLRHERLSSEEAEARDAIAAAHKALGEDRECCLWGEATQEGCGEHGDLGEEE